MATEDRKNSINSGISDLLAQLERRRKLAELYKTGIIPHAGRVRLPSSDQASI